MKGRGIRKIRNSRRKKKRRTRKLKDKNVTNDSEDVMQEEE